MDFSRAFHPENLDIMSALYGSHLFCVRVSPEVYMKIGFCGRCLHEKVHGQRCVRLDSGYMYIRQSS